jgi:hypothetical protein
VAASHRGGVRTVHEYAPNLVHYQPLNTPRRPEQQAQNHLKMAYRLPTSLSIAIKKRSIFGFAENPEKSSNSTEIRCRIGGKIRSIWTT